MKCVYLEYRIDIKMLVNCVLFEFKVVFKIYSLIQHSFIYSHCSKQRVVRRESSFMPLFSTHLRLSPPLKKDGQSTSDSRRISIYCTTSMYCTCHDICT